MALFDRCDHLVFGQRRLLGFAAIDDLELDHAARQLIAFRYIAVFQAHDVDRERMRQLVLTRHRRLSIRIPILFAGTRVFAKANAEVEGAKRFARF